MKPLSLNMSKFKKIKSDKNSSTFQHADGHQMTVLHNSLSPEMSKAIQALPTASQDAADASEANSQKMDLGGEVNSNMAALQRGANATKDAQNTASKPAQTSGVSNGVGAEDAATAGANQTANEDSTTDQYGHMEFKAKGGEVGNPKLEQSKLCPHCNGGKMMADGGDVDPAANSTPALDPVGKPDIDFSLPPTPDNSSTAYKVGNVVHGAVSGAVNQIGRNLSPDTNPVLGAVADVYHGMVNDSPTGEGAKPASPAAVAQVAQANGDQPTAQAAAQQAAAQPQTDPMGLGALQSGLQKGFEEQKAGVQQEAAAEGAQGQQTSQALDANAQQQQQQQNNYQQHFDQLNGEYKNFMSDIQNQHIDPNHYWESKSTGSKVATGLGLILGGLDGGLGHTGNSALEFLQNNINRDIDAQKANLGKSENLLNSNMRQFGNLRDATDMTRIMQQGIVANQLQSIAAKSTDPLAKSRAQQALGVIDQHQATEMQQFAQRRYLMSMMQGQGSQSGIPGDNSQHISAMRMMGNEPMAKSLEERSVPGVGTAKVPVPEDARQKMIAMQNFHKQMSDLMDFASQHSGDLSPTDRITGRAKAQAVQNAYRTGQDMGVYKASEAPLLEGEIPNNPTAFLNSIRVQPAYKAALDNNKMKLGTMTQAYGLPNPIAAHDQAAKSAQPQIKISGGKKYMRGPNGEAIEVQ